MPRSLLTHTLGVTAAMALLVSTAATASQRVLIIGGAGHAGSAVARMLIERGDHVTAFVRSATDRHWICKRANEGPVVSGNVPACGEMPRVTEAQLRGNP